MTLNFLLIPSFSWLKEYSSMYLKRLSCNLYTSSSTMSHEPKGWGCVVCRFISWGWAPHSQLFSAVLINRGFLIQYQLISPEIIYLCAMWSRLRRLRLCIYAFVCLHKTIIIKEKEVLGEREWEDKRGLRWKGGEKSYNWFKQKNN